MSSGFVTENEIEERRKHRQEEWDRVRKEDEPKQVPEEPYDSRSLFDRLQEQKDKKQAEWDESRQLKNQVRTIDCDEADFLDKVDAFKMDQERERIREEKRTIEEYRKIQEQLLEQELVDRKKKELEGVSAKRNVQTSSTGNKQSKLLAGMIVRKRNKESENDIVDDAKKSKDDDDVKTSKEDDVVKTSPELKSSEKTFKGLGALAGLGSYNSDSDEDET